MAPAARARLDAWSYVTGGRNDLLPPLLEGRGLQAPCRSHCDVLAGWGCHGSLLASPARAGLEPGNY